MGFKLPLPSLPQPRAVGIWPGKVQLNGKVEKAARLKSGNVDAKNEKRVGRRAAETGNAETGDAKNEKRIGCRADSGHKLFWRRWVDVVSVIGDHYHRAPALP